MKYKDRCESCGYIFQPNKSNLLCNVCFEEKTKKCELDELERLDSLDTEDL